MRSVGLACVCALWAGVLPACDDGGLLVEDAGAGGGDAAGGSADGAGGTGPDAGPGGAPDDASPPDADAAPDAGAPPSRCPPAGTVEEGSVLTTEGRLQGIRASETWAFLGVPFAAPPVGDLRWATPREPACYEGVRRADATAPLCPQWSRDDEIIGDEDCLYLNLWAPVAGPAVDEAGHPVLVFIHGGGNAQGGASVRAGGELLYDGRLIAQTHGVIVVVIQYRIGALGYLSAEGVSPGNLGLRDQIAALRWVQANAGAFGGDPTRVMVFGESAGGINVCALVASPMAAGLFHAALIQSGGCTVRNAEVQAEQNAAQITASDCDEADDVAACLRARTAEQLLTDLRPVVSVAGLTEALGPVVDGEVLTGVPQAVIAAGEHNAVPLVVGANADETSLSIPQVADATAYERLIRAQFPFYAARILELYPVEDFASPAAAYTAVTTDAKFVCGARRIARTASAGQAAPVWLYHFAQGLSRAPRLSAFGAYHGLELFFVFGALTTGGYQPTDGEIALGAAMRGYWSRLAATGDPNGEDAAAWPEYEAEGDRHLLLAADGIEAASGLRGARCDFWDELTDSAPGD